MRVRFTKSSRRHRIGRGSVFHVLANSDRTFAGAQDGSILVWWIGTDERDRELEVMGRYIIDDRTGEHALLIIHVMPAIFRR